jgi:antitoxin component of MazEF toxin-antitoxin module
MRKRLTSHGNSFALVIEKPVLQLLNISPETELDITTDGKKIIVSPVGRGKGKRLATSNLGG